MCVIVHKPVGSKIPDEVLDQGWAKHSDGGGFVYIDGGKVILKKGIMTLAEFKKETEPYRKEKGILVCHLRYQTKGGKCAELTHPFDFSRNGITRTLFHNGTVKFLKAEDKLSDSLALANMLKILPDDDCLAILTTLRDQTKNEQFPNKFVAILGNQVHIIENKDSVTKDGLWYSNTRHEVQTAAKWTADYDDGEYYANFKSQTQTIQKKTTKIEPTISIITKDERKETASTAVWKLGVANKKEDDVIAAYSFQLLKDYNFTDWSDRDMCLLKQLVDDKTNENPLLKFFENKIAT